MEAAGECDLLKGLLTSVVAERASPSTVASPALFLSVAIQQNRH
jgi:hypothetical protein